MSSSDRPLVLWASALAVAGLGTWLMFDAMPGINWGIWTGAAAAVLFVFARKRTPTLVVLAFTATVLALGASITADPFISALIVLSVILYLGMAMLLSADATLSRITPVFAIPSPIVAFASAVTESFRRATDALQLVRSSRARSVVRGIAITLPVLVIFTLLLASADPVFAEWRDAIQELLESLAFIPRTIFFIGLLTIVLGAYGFAERNEVPPVRVAGERSAWLGTTERLILLGGVAILLWVFIAVQVSYLFGNLPQAAGSNMTFAEYARRGFAELTIVASISVLLILLGERYGKREKRGLTLGVTIALIVAVLFLLGSAFNRVLLYEQAYGFTTARLYAQSYMVVVTIVLLALAWELRGELDASRLFRTAGMAATLAFIVLIYWNHEAWIAGKNIDRFRESGQLDNRYLVRDLSLNAVPTLVGRLASIPEPARSDLRRALENQYKGRRNLFDNRWFEWNQRRSEARSALENLGTPGLLDQARPVSAP